MSSLDTVIAANRDFLPEAKKAIESWSKVEMPNWSNNRWKEKKPKSDGQISSNRWRLDAADITARFNTEIAPLTVSLFKYEQDAFHDQPMKQFRVFLAEKAGAAAASKRARSLL